jgi:hypothetical protein
MNAFNYIKNHIFVKLKPSSIAGIGVFSLKDIPADKTGGNNHSQFTNSIF